MTPPAIAQGNAVLFFFRIREALAEVDADDDVVIVDCPPQTRISAFLRRMCGDRVPNAPMLKRIAISDAGLTGQIPCEVERSAFTRSIYDGAIDSVNAVNDEIVPPVPAPLVSDATCIDGRALLSGKATASRMNSGENSRRVFGIIHLHALHRLGKGVP